LGLCVCPSVLMEGTVLPTPYWLRWGAL
jgi:hypothetical protein